MSNEAIASEFLNYINSHYHKLISGFQKSSFKKDITDDVFHDSILSIHQSITNKGFKFNKIHLSGKSFENLLFVSCCNVVLQKKRIIKTKGHNIYFDSDSVFDNHTYLCSEFQYNIEEELQSEIEKINEDLLIEDIRNFIKKNHTHLDCGIFEFYFRSGLSLAKIGELTGYSTRTIFLKVNKVKASVINQFADSRLNHRLIIKEEKSKLQFNKKKIDPDEYFK